MNSIPPPPTPPPSYGNGEQPFHQPSQPVGVQVSVPRVKPYVAYTIMGVTILVYLLQAGTLYLLGTDVPALLGIKANDLIVQGQLWRLLTPMLLHGSLIHILVNMYALNAFGPGLERHFGHWRFLALYTLSGFAGNVTSFVFSPAYSLGSSTAIFGLLAAEGVFLYQNRALFGSRARQALINIMLIAALNLFIIGLSPGIDNWGHVGGLLGGLAFAWLSGPKLRVEGIYPTFNVTDNREPGDVLRAGLGVGLLFALLAAVTIFMRGQ